MFKRITAIILAFVLFVNIFVGTVAVNTVPVKADAITIGGGITAIDVALNFLIGGYGVHYYSENVDGSNALEDGWDDELAEEYDTSADYIEFLTSAAYLKRQGYPPDPDKDPREDPAWIALFINIGSTALFGNAVNEVAESMPQVVDWLKNGVPQPFWKFKGDDGNSIAFGSPDKIYHYKLDGHYFRKVEDDPIEHPFDTLPYGNVMYDTWQNYFDKCDFYLLSSYLVPAGVAGSGTQCSHVFMFPRGVNGVVAKYRPNYNIAIPDTTLYPDYYRFGVKVSSIGAVSTYEGDEFGNVTLGYSMEKDRGDIYTNMLYIPGDESDNYSFGRFVVPLNLNQNFNIKNLDQNFINDSIDNEYIPVIPDTIIDPDTGLEIPDWSQYDFLTKDNLKDILTDPEVLEAYQNSMPLKSNVSGETVENINSNTGGILTQLKNLPKNIYNKFKNVLGNIKDGVTNMASNVYDAFRSMLERMQSTLIQILAWVQDIPTVITNLIEDLPGKLSYGWAGSFKNLLVPSPDDLAAIKDTAGTFFDKYFGMPKVFFNKLMVEGKDVPDIKCTIRGKTYTVVRFGWFNEFVEDFRPYIQIVFVIIWMLWLANQFISLFDKSGIVGGSINDINSGSR